MESIKIYNFYKEMFDKVFEKCGVSIERLNDYIEIIAEDELLSDCHYEILRRYFINKCYGLSVK